jgi:hypothetical protein
MTKNDIAGERVGAREVAADINPSNTDDAGTGSDRVLSVVGDARSCAKKRYPILRNVL